MNPSTTSNKKDSVIAAILNPNLWDKILLGLGCLYLCANFYNHLLTFRWSAIGFLVIFICLTLALAFEKLALKMGVAFLVLVGSGLLTYSQFALDRLLPGESKEVHSLSLLVRKESSFKTLADLNNASLAYSQQTPQGVMDQVFTTLSSQGVAFKEVSTTPDAISLVTQLLEGHVDVIALEEGQKSLAKEAYPDMDQKLLVVQDEKVQGQKTAAKPVDLSFNPFVVLISGNDVQGDLSQVSRSDVNILVAVHPKKHQVLTMSIPRDSYLPIPCKQEALDKLTHTGLSGISCTIATIEELVGVPINYYARVNFTSFMDILDVLGEIDVESHYDFHGHLGTWFIKGKNRLTSQQALEFVRTRKTVAGGDFTRGIHQQEVIKGMIKKLLSPSSLFKIESIIQKLSQSIDTNLDSQSLAKLIRYQLSENPSWDINSIGLTGLTGMETTASTPNQALSVVYLDQDQVTQAKKDFKEFLEGN